MMWPHLGVGKSRWRHVWIEYLQYMTAMLRHCVVQHNVWNVWQPCCMMMLTYNMSNIYIYIYIHIYIDNVCTTWQACCGIVLRYLWRWRVDMTLMLLALCGQMFALSGSHMSTQCLQHNCHRMGGGKNGTRISGLSRGISRRLANICQHNVCKTYHMKQKKAGARISSLVEWVRRVSSQRLTNICQHNVCSMAVIYRMGGRKRMYTKWRPF